MSKLFFNTNTHAIVWICSITNGYVIYLSLKASFTKGHVLYYRVVIVNLFKTHLPFGNGYFNGAIGPLHLNYLEGIGYNNKRFSARMFSFLLNRCYLFSCQKSTSFSLYGIIYIHKLVEAMYQRAYVLYINSFFITFQVGKMHVVNFVSESYLAVSLRCHSMFINFQLKVVFTRVRYMGEFVIFRLSPFTNESMYSYYRMPTENAGI